MTCQNHSHHTCEHCELVEEYHNLKSDIARREATGEPIAAKEWEVVDDLAHAIVEDCPDHAEAAEEPREPTHMPPDNDPHAVTLPLAQWGTVLRALVNAQSSAEDISQARQAIASQLQTALEAAPLRS